MRDGETYALRLADDALVLAQGLSKWVACAPELEEDLALANIALDLLGQARLLLSIVGDEDELAYLRDERRFTNLLIVEQPNGDFAQTIVRQLLFSRFQLARYEALAGAVTGAVADVAQKAAKEVRYHCDHAERWTLRLGDGTDESRGRTLAALELLWPYTHEMFDGDAVDRAAGVDPATLREPWLASVTATLEGATLTPPADDGWRPGGGRGGVHTEHLGYLLAEMQSLHRAHPGARW